VASGREAEPLQFRRRGFGLLETRERTQAHARSGRNCSGSRGVGARIGCACGSAWLALQPDRLQLARRGRRDGSRSHLGGRNPADPREEQQVDEQQQQEEEAQGTARETAMRAMVSN